MNYLQTPDNCLEDSSRSPVWGLRAIRYSHGNGKSTDKWSLTCFEMYPKKFDSNYLWFCSNLPVIFAIFLKSSLLSNNFYGLFCL